MNHQEEQKIASFQFLARIFRKQNLHQKAIYCYQECLLIDKNNPTFLNMIGYLYFLLGDYESALSRLNQALSINKNNFISHHYLGLVFKDLGFFAKAIRHLKFAYDISSNDKSAYHLADIYRIKEGYDEACKWYGIVSGMQSEYQLDADYMLASLGQTSALDRAPRPYIEKLFNGYSDNFEANLVKDLDYRVPQIFFEILASQETKKTYNRCLDLGCGTGLCGSSIAKFCKNIDGVDISEKMLSLASRKEVYASLHKADIIDYLTDCKQLYDLVVCADVLIYFGDLSQVLELLGKVLINSGSCLFSIELQDKGTYTLQKTARFSHSEKYISGLAKQYKFEIKYSRKVSIRSENKVPLRGKVFLFQKLVS